jgi:beta-lactamase class A
MVRRGRVGRVRGPVAATLILLLSLLALPLVAAATPRPDHLSASRTLGVPSTTAQSTTEQDSTEESGTAEADAVTAFGNAGSAVPGSALPGLNAPIVGIAPTPDGNGYLLVSSDGGVFTFGDATFAGSLGNLALNAPIVGIAATPDGHGYWLVGADGGVFTFGDATFAGSLGNLALNAPIVGIASTSDGHGYWLVAADGGVFTFGDATFAGSLGNLALNAPIVGMASTSDGHGYWLVAADGGVFTLGDASFAGSDAAAGTNGAAAVGLAARSGGYWVAYGANAAAEMIPKIAAYVGTRADNVTVAVDDLKTGQIFQFRAGVVEHTASTLKVDILATLLTEAQAAGRTLTSAEQALAVPMIEDSLDSAADALWGRLGPTAVGAFERAAGMTDTVPATDDIWGTTTTTALDRLAMIRTLVQPNALLSDTSRHYVLDLMEHINPQQDWGATDGVPPGVTVALKNGFAVVDGWQINTTGWVEGDGRNYLIAVLTDENQSEAYAIDTVGAISNIVWRALSP